jgi:hypothetical protein
MTIATVVTFSCAAYLFMIALSKLIAAEVKKQLNK